LRQEVLREIEEARAQVEAQLAALMILPNRAEVAEQIAELQGQLSQLDGMRGQAATGNLVQLSALQVGMTVTMGAIQNQMNSVAMSAGARVSQSVMLMTHIEMEAMTQAYAEQSAQFQSFEAEMFARIDALAAENGVDVAAFHERQRQLLAEYEKARARGDLRGMLEADALRATNVRIGLEEVGATPAEIAAARQQEQAAQDAYLGQTAIEARQAAEEQGLSADDVAAQVEAEVAEAESRVKQRWNDFLSEGTSVNVEVKFPRSAEVIFPTFGIW
jgi:hypothetical protein